MRKIFGASITHEIYAVRKKHFRQESFHILHYEYFKTETVLTCVTRDAPQDARQAGQRPAPPAVLRLQHGQVLVPDVRRNDQILQISLVYFRKLVQSQFLQQRLLHILMGKSLDESTERGAEDTSAEEIHEEKRARDAEHVNLWKHKSPRGGRRCSDTALGSYIVAALPLVRTLSMGAGTLIRTKVRPYSPNRISK